MDSFACHHQKKIAFSLIILAHRKIATSKTTSCSNNGGSSASGGYSEQGPPQEAVLKAISEVSRAEGRVGQTTNVVIGGTVRSEGQLEDLLQIGSSSDDFVNSMIVAAVESIFEQPVPAGQVKQKISSGGKYVSVNIGPFQVVSSEQVQAVYNAMRKE